MTIHLLYGKGSIAIDLPAGCEPHLVEKRPMPLLADPGAAIAESLAKPVGTAPLLEHARGKGSACILICDITRPVPNHLFLPATDRDAARGRRAEGADRRRGRDGPAPPERGRGAGRAGGRSLGHPDGPGRQPLRHQGRGSRRSRPHQRPRHRRPARPAAGRGGAQDRHRPGRAAFHGRLQRRAKGHRSRRRARRDHHHLPQLGLHGAIPRPPIACSTATRCTRNSWRSWACWAEPWR